MNNHFDKVECIVDFLNSINIKVVEQELPEDTFLPGINLKGQSILMDLKKLKYPGDLLHEAGHIAVTEAKDRAFIGTKEMPADWPTVGDEIVAILWSYAACRNLDLDLEVVFHPNGYKGSSEWFIDQFNQKIFTGLNCLEWMSLCDAKEFPKMKKWLR